ncbi:DctP family TRAP transporter solute-binding subunit [Oscillospiraceae bacterium LTW-04]|nr:DctP family TRAP transporter solute-binding subunit [Oscillospiraceae bacterium MB24-C1]
MNEPNKQYSSSFFSVFGVLAFSIFLIIITVVIRTQVMDGKSGDEKDVIYLRLAEIHSASYPSSLGAAEFSRLVSEKTDGRIKIELFCNGQLGTDEYAIAEQVQFGGIDFACVDTAALVDYAPILDILQLPYLIKSTEHLHKVLDSELGQKLLSSAEKNKIIGLAFYDEGQRIYCNSVRMVSRTIDLEGLRLGVPKNQIYSDMVELLGAQTVSLAYGDIYRSLQTGRINGLEHSLLNYISSRYYIEAKYITLDGHSMAPSILITGKDVFDTLSPEDQAIIREAAAQSVAVQRKAYSQAEIKAAKFLEGDKCEVVTNPWTTSMFTIQTAPIYDKYQHYAKEIGLIKSMK